MLTGQLDNVLSVAFSPNGESLATGNDAGTILLWDVTNPSLPLQLGKSLIISPKAVTSVAFSPDGEKLASGDQAGTIRLWDINPKSWATHACQEAGRNFDQAEWTEYFPGEPYHATCSQWAATP